MSTQRIFCKTLLQGDQWLENAVLTVGADGIIMEIAQGRPSTADICVAGIVVPGMPNAHSHTFQRLIAGLTGQRGSHQDSFWSWREAMYQCAGSISPAQFADVSAWVFVEMLKAGFTTCAEFHYIHHQPGGDAYANPAEMSERLIESAASSGISLTILPVLYNTSGFGQPQPDVLQRRFVNSADGYLQLLECCRELISDRPLVSLGLAPHSLRAVPETVLTDVLQAWPDKHCPVHIHIAEQKAEIESCVAHLGSTPVEWLLDQFPVNERWSLVHATHMTNDELEQAAARRVCAVLCPTTEADLGDGVFRTGDWLRAGGDFAIGSDSNVRISVAEELRLLEYNERLKSGRRNVLSEDGSTCGRFLFQHAARAGAVSTGQPVGILAPGYRADLLELDGRHELMVNREPDVALESWIFAGNKSMIHSVWVAGQRLVNQGHHAREEELRAKFSNVLSGLHSI